MERKPLSFSIVITVTGAALGAGGSGSNTTPSNSAIANAGGYLRQVIVDAPEDTASFDFRIENANSRVVYRRTGQIGEIVEEVQTPLPAGTYTLFCSNCSHNGSYVCEIIFAEVY